MKDSITPSRRRFIAIGGQPRSGGSLLARMLDGNAGLAVFPDEPNFFLYSGDAPRRFRVRMDGSAGSLADVLRAAGLDRRLFGKLLKEEVYSSSSKKFELHFSRKRIDEMLKLQASGCAEYEDALELFAQLFFEACNEHSGQWNDVKVVAFHKANLYTYRIDELMRSGRMTFVHTLRHPLDQLGSIRRLAPKYYRKTAANLEANMFGWAISAIQAAIMSRRYPGRYYVLKYEDLVKDPSRLNALLQALDLSVEQTNFEPTVMGRYWHGNSSFGDKRGLDGGSIGRFLDAFDEEERAIANDAIGELAALFNYDFESHEVGLGGDFADLQVDDLAFYANSLFFNYISVYQRPAPDGAVVRLAREIDAFLHRDVTRSDSRYWRILARRRG